MRSYRERRAAALFLEGVRDFQFDAPLGGFAVKSDGHSHGKLPGIYCGISDAGRDRHLRAAHAVAGLVVEFENAVNSAVFVGSGQADAEVGVGGDGAAEQAVDAKLARTGPKIFVRQQQRANAESSGVEMILNAAGGQDQIDLGGHIDDIGVDELIEIVLAVEGQITHAALAAVSVIGVVSRHPAADGKLGSE
jgi:hypothetical protein